MVVLLKYDCLAQLAPCKSFFYVQLSFTHNIEHAPLPFNELKVKIWNLLQFFQCLVTFQPPGKFNVTQLNYKYIRHNLSSGHVSNELHSEQRVPIL